MVEGVDHHQQIRRKQVEKGHLVVGMECEEEMEEMESLRGVDDVLEGDFGFGSGEN